MKAPKCANCGTQLLETYTREGLRLYVCPHVTIKQVNKITGKFRYGEIHCRANVQGLQASFKKLVDDHESTTTLESLRRATQYTVSDSILLENANLAMQLGVPADELPKLYGATFKLSLALGITIDYGIKSLCKGIARKRLIILDNIGVSFRAEDAYSWFTETYKIDRKLTEDERDQAWKRFAIEKVKEQAAMLQ